VPAQAINHRAPGVLPRLAKPHTERAPALYALSHNFSDEVFRMNKQEFAEVLGLTVRQVDRLLVERTIPPMKKSGFDLEHVACYVKYMRRGEGV
jgi:hypothetical protein